jgi:hypothetical protein
VPKISHWDVLVVKFDCGCEDHHRRQKGVERKFIYFDCSVHCKIGSKDCKQSFEESREAAAKASEE